VPRNRARGSGDNGRADLLAGRKSGALSLTASYPNPDLANRLIQPRQKLAPRDGHGRVVKERDDLTSATRYAVMMLRSGKTGGLL